MKIGVLGDSHRNKEDIDRAIERLKEVDLIIHTGDMITDAQYITDKYHIQVVGVKGNCDIYNKGQEEIICEIGSKRIYVCHGHQYGVKSTLRIIASKGKAQNADVVIFGHTHIPFHEKLDNLHLLNPGSIALPRGLSQKSFALMEINEIISIKHIGICKFQRLDNQ